MRITNYGRPYAGEVCAVSFGDDKSLHVPRELLCQVERMSLYFTVIPGYKPCLKEMSSETGHVLIHFLICGDYQCLRPQGDSLEERRVSEFKTALDVYVAAESLQLPRLRDLARREIARLGDNLSLPSIISAIEDSGRSLKTLPGVSAYVESRILSFGEEATPEGVDETLAELERPETLSRTLLKTMVLLKRSELYKNQKKIDENGGQGFGETVNSVSEEERVRERISPAELAMKEAEAKAEAIAKQEAEEAEAKAKALAEKELEEKAIRAAEEEEAIRGAKEEEEWLKDEAELQRLRNKRFERGGKLIKRDQIRFIELAERSARRAEARNSCKPKPKAYVITSEGQVTVNPEFTFPTTNGK